MPLRRGIYKTQLFSKMLTAQRSFEDMIVGELDLVGLGMVE